jgi:hypothetical protein
MFNNFFVSVMRVGLLMSLALSVTAADSTSTTANSNNPTAENARGWLELGNDYGYAVVIVFLTFLVWLWFGFRPWLNKQSNKADGMEIDIREIKTDSKTMLRQLSEMGIIWDVVEQRYSNTFSKDIVARIFHEQINGTRDAIAYYVFAIIAEDKTTAKSWSNIEQKVEGYITGQMTEDLEILKQYKLSDGRRLSELLNMNRVESIREFCLLATKGKFTSKDLKDGLDNIFRDVYNDALRELGRVDS